MGWKAAWLEQTWLQARREGAPLPVGEETPCPRQSELSLCSAQSGAKMRGFCGAWEARLRSLELKLQGASCELEKISSISAKSVSGGDWAAGRGAELRVACRFPPHGCIVFEDSSNSFRLDGPLP